jgi:hypothetical protein
MEDQPEDSREQAQTQPIPPPPVLIPPANLSPIPPIAGEGAARLSGNEQTHNPSQPPKDKLTKNDVVMIVLTGFIAFGTIVSAVAIGFQWHEMHEGGKDTTVIAEAAKKQVGAASSFATSAEGVNTEIGTAETDFAKMAKNSEKAIQATQDAMRSDQRAWVVVKGIEGTPQLGQPWEVHVVFANTGRTPAKKVKITCSLESEKGSNTFRFRKSPYDQQQTLIVPNQDPYCALPMLFR